VKPVLQALVIAEKVYQDVTGKKIIAGTFNGVQLSTQPVVETVEDGEGNKRQRLLGGTNAGSPFAYVSLTDVCDNTTIELKFVSLTANKEIFGRALVVPSNDRLQTIELVLPLPDLLLVLGSQGPGVYAFEVMCEGEVIGSHRINVTMAPGPELPT
jgi:hypothetical protein